MNQEIPEQSTRGSSPCCGASTEGAAAERGLDCHAMMARVMDFMAGGCDKAKGCMQRMNDVMQRANRERKGGESDERFDEPGRC